MMRILFIHQGFPGQFKHLIPALQHRGHEIWAISRPREKHEIPVNVRYANYTTKRINSNEIHPLCLEIESKVIRGEAVANIGIMLKKEGFIPDLILGHPGWGEMLYLGDIWPNVPQMHYVEFFYGVKGTDDDFDGGLPAQRSWNDRARARMKNLHNLSNLEQMKIGITPTHFQHNLLPSWAASRTIVVHDGIDTDWLKPNKNAQVIIAPRINLPHGLLLRAGDPVITFINRTFEPYRGVHIFLEALSKLQSINPHVQTLLVGHDTAKVSYGASREDGIGWLTALKQQLGNSLDWTRIHHLGQISHQRLREVYQVSAAHTYLSYPFVLSWSLLEAMSCGALVIGSATDPVKEVIEDEVNGLLVPFKDAEMLSQLLNSAVNNQSMFQKIREHSRSSIINRYQLNSCLERQINAVESLW